MRRTLIPITLALVLALGLGLLLGAATPSTAIKVNGEKVPTSQVNADLAAASGNARYLCYMNLAALVRSGGSTGLGSVHGATSASYSADFVTSWLDQDITGLIIQQGAQQEGMATLTQGQLLSAQTDAARTILTTQLRVDDSRLKKRTTDTLAELLKRMETEDLRLMKTVN